MSDVDTHAAGPGNRSRTPAPVSDLVVPRQGGRLADLIIRQVRAIDAWTAACAQREQMLQSVPLSRDERLDVSRRLDVLHRADQAVRDRADLALATDVAPMPSSLSVRAVLAHRHAWTLQRLASLLDELGVEVLVCTDNGAEALGTVVAEQPDVLFTGERLAMLSGSELVSEAALFAPFTLLAVQAADRAAERDLLGAEAQLVLPYRQPVAETAQTLVAAATQRAAVAG